MAEFYEKELVRPGLYAADGGDTIVTPERIDRWEREFNQLRSEGYGFPTPWGHKLSAVPYSQDDPYALDEAYARWNAGDMEEVVKKNGKLYVVGTVPPGYKVDESQGALVNEKDGTIVRYVSPGFGNWTDGQGRQHQDVLFHTALCTHPVQHEQEGFRKATKPPRNHARASNAKFLSAAGRVTNLTFMALPKGPNMADDADDKKKKDDPPAKPKDAGGDSGGGGLEDIINDAAGAAATGGGGDIGGGAPTGLDDSLSPPVGADGVAPLDATPDPLATPAMPAEDPAAADPAGLGQSGTVVTPEQATQFVQIFGQLGSPMLPGTNASNIIERMLIILHSAANQGATLSPASQGGQQMQGLDLGMEGASPDENGMGSGMGGPTFMSTKTRRVVTLDPAGRKLAETAAADEMAAIGAEWDRLAGTKGISANLKAIFLREKAGASRYHMSLNPDTGKVLNERARQKLFYTKEILANTPFAKILGMLSKGVAQSTPAKLAPRARPSTEQPSSTDLQNELARLRGVKPEDVQMVTGVPA